METKKCEDACPKCISDNIKWGDKEYCGEVIYQPGTCNDCGCEFKEYYGYVETEYEGKKVDKDKVLRLLEKALSYQFDGIYTWDNMVDDIEDLTDEEQKWAKEHTTYKVSCDEE